jgi:hypothetical protein
MSQREPIDYLYTVLFERDVWEIPISVFAIVSLALIASTAALAGGFWLNAKVRTTPDNSVQLRYWNSFALLFPPAAKGVTLTVGCISLPILMLHVCLGGNHKDTTYLGLFNGLSGDFLHESLSAEVARNGRYGLCFCILGATILNHALQILAPLKMSAKEELLQRKKAIRTASMMPLEGKHLFSESKFAYFRYITVVVIVYSLFVNFFSFSDEYSSSRQLMYLAAITMVGELVKKKLLDAIESEQLLAVPFLIVVEVMNLFVARLSSSNFRQVIENVVAGETYSC